MDNLQLQNQIINCVKKLPDNRLANALNYLQKLLDETEDEKKILQETMTREELILAIRKKQNKEPLKVLKYENPFELCELKTKQ